MINGTIENATVVGYTATGPRAEHSAGRRQIDRAVPMARWARSLRPWRALENAQASLAVGPGHDDQKHTYRSCRRERLGLELDLDPDRPRHYHRVARKPEGLEFVEGFRWKC
jgi:hypothetical protein